MDWTSHRHSHGSRRQGGCWAVAALLFAGATVAQEPKDPLPGVDLGLGISAEAAGGPDAFGYTFADQDEGTCAQQLVDISATGTLVDWGLGGSDDSALAQTLSAPFDFYGTSYTELAIATNGYISTDPDDTGTSLGGGFPDQSMCPVPDPLLSGDGARMYPLLDDLVTDTAYVEYFSVCPRAGDRCRADEDCTIFLWKDTYHFGSPGDTFDVEAILYHQTYDLVFQIGAGNPELGTASTTGIQSEPTSPMPPTYPTGTPDSGLTYACDTASSVLDDTAVCFFHPNTVPDACVFSDLEIGKLSDAAPRVEPGTLVVYTLTVTNNGPDDARGTTVSDDLPAGVSYLSDDCAAGPPIGTLLTWEITNLPSSSLAACNVTVEVVGARGTTVDNTASVGLDNFDPDGANNVSGVATFDIGFHADLEMDKSVTAPADIPPGTPVVYTLTVSNNGPDEAIDATVTDDLPFGVEYVSNDCGAPAPVGTLFTWDAGNIATGAPAICNVTVLSLLLEAQIDNTASVTAVSFDPDGGNNSDTDTFSVIFDVPGAVFFDNFETGDASRWTRSLPPI